MKKTLKVVFIVLMLGVMLCLCACSSATIKALNKSYEDANTIIKDGLIRVGAISKDGNMRYGFLDKRGKVKIPLTYMYASEFSEGLAVVSTDGIKFGFINKKQKSVIPENYTEAYPFVDGYAIVKNNEGKYGVINKKQTYLLGFTYDSIQYVPQKKCFICSQTGVDGNKKFGIIDIKGNKVLDLLYKSVVIDEDYVIIQDFNSTYGLKKYSDKNFSIEFGKYVYLDYTEGRVVAAVKNENNETKYGLLKLNGKVLHEFDFSSAFSFGNEGFAVAFKTLTGANKSAKNYTYLINKNGKEIASSYSNDIDAFIDVTPSGYTIFRFNGRYGLLKSSNGKIVLDPIYDDIDLFMDDENFTLNINGQVYLTNAKGDKLLKETFDGISFVSGNRYAVIKTGRYAFVDKRCNKKCEYLYDRIYPCYKNTGMYKVRIENKYGFINKNGKVKISVKYDYLGSCFIDGVTVAGKKTDNVMQYGVLKQNGKALTEFKYDLIGNVD